MRVGGRAACLMSFIMAPSHVKFDLQLWSQCGSMYTCLIRSLLGNTLAYYSYGKETRDKQSSACAVVCFCACILVSAPDCISGSRRDKATGIKKGQSRLICHLSSNPLHPHFLPQPPPRHLPIPPFLHPAPRPEGHREESSPPKVAG